MYIFCVMWTLTAMRGNRGALSCGLDSDDLPYKYGSDLKSFGVCRLCSSRDT